MRSKVQKASYFNKVIQFFIPGYKVADPRQPNADCICERFSDMQSGREERRKIAASQDHRALRLN